MNNPLRFSLRDHHDKASHLRNTLLSPQKGLQLTTQMFFLALQRSLDSQSQSPSNKRLAGNKYNDGEIVLTGSGSIRPPLCGTLIFGGMGDACQSCHSSLSQYVTGSTGLHTNRHIAWNQDVVVLATEILPLTDKLWNIFLLSSAGCDAWLIDTERMIVTEEGPFSNAECVQFVGYVPLKWQINLAMLSISAVPKGKK